MKTTGSVMEQTKTEAQGETRRIKRVVAVMSGKGGVGKSTVSALLAVSLGQLGNKVGILDADITGPSIPKLFGLSAKPEVHADGILPVRTQTNIEVISINLLLSDDTAATIWRGPLISKAIVQFWNDVVWGELDYLIIDLPPGTSDAALTTMQQIPVSAVVMVTTPQALAGLIVRKAMNMTELLKIPVLGIVENMAFFPDPASGKPLELFGPRRAKELADEFTVPLLAQLPIDPQIAVLCDAGEIEQYHSEAVSQLAAAVMERLAAMP